MNESVRVVATTVEGTRAALAAAALLAKGAGARLVLIVPHIVSSSGDLDIPPTSTQALADRYRQLAHALGVDIEIQICVSVGFDALMKELCADRSIVIVGGPTGRWLTSPEERFADRLAAAGCQVLFAASGAHTTQRRTAA